ASPYRGRPVRSGCFGGGKLSVILFLLLLLVVAATVAAVGWLLSKRGTTPLATAGAPVFSSDAAGERVYMLTGQWERIRVTGRRGSSFVYINLNVDLWAFDAPTAAPLWRKRLETEREGDMYNRHLLGLDQGVLWLLLQG